jgi:cytoplasmic iron level regulating protein YaaA (DUF328/UPF0246 family)
MLTIISPAKTLDFSKEGRLLQPSMPFFATKTSELIDRLKQLSVYDIAKLMEVSEKISSLNKERFDSLSADGKGVEVKSAIFAYRGDVYKSLAAQDLSDEQIYFAQQHLLIVSGLYGLLKPLDLIQPYRLEMSVALSNSRGKDLYSFWREAITNSLNEQISHQSNKVLVVLASKEYYQAIDFKNLKAKSIFIDFKEERDGELKTIALLAKKARGLMSRYIVVNKIDQEDQLKSFTEGGYKFLANKSGENNFVFVR